MTTPLVIVFWLIALSILVQVIQQLWREFSRSEARTFEKALVDLLGTSVWRALRGEGPVEARGPFARWRRRAVYDLPMDRDSLLSVLATAAPAWQVTVLRVLEEQQRSSGDSDAYPTACLDDVLCALERTVARPDPPAAASEVAAFLDHMGVRPGRLVNGTRAVLAFRRRFFPHLMPLAEDYPQFLRSAAHSYGRRTYRELFAIASVVALVANVAALPADPASRLGDVDSGVATELTNAVVVGPCPGGADRLPVPRAACGAAAMERVAGVAEDPPRAGWFWLLRYLLMSCLTALLLTSGASLANEIVLALRPNRGQPPLGIGDSHLYE